MSSGTVALARTGQPEIQQGRVGDPGCDGIRLFRWRSWESAVKNLAAGLQHRRHVIEVTQAAEV